MSKLHAYTGVLYEGSIWYSCIEMNSLYRFDIAKKVNKFVCLFPDEKSGQREMHRICQYVNGIIIFLPFQGNHIHIYTPNSYMMESIFFSEYVYDSFVVDDEIWMICGLNGEKLYVFNVIDKTLREIKEYKEAYKTLGVQGGRRFKYHNGHIWFGCLGTNRIADWDIEKSELRVHNTDIKNIFAICPTDNACWVIDRDTPNIHEWNYSDHVTTHNIDDIEILADIGKLSVPPRYYNNLFKFMDRIILLPAYTDSITVFEGKEHQAVKIKVPNNARNLPKCFGYAHDINNVYILPFCTDELIHITASWDIQIGDAFQNSPNCLSLAEQKRVMKEAQDEKGYIVEGALFGLNDFLSVVSHKSGEDYE